MSAPPTIPGASPATEPSLEEALRPVAEAITDEANRRAQQILDDADAQVNAVLDDARRQADELLASALADGAGAARRAAAMLVDDARRQAREQVLAAQRHVYEQVRSRARARLDALADSPEAGGAESAPGRVRAEPTGSRGADGGARERARGRRERRAPATRPELGGSAGARARLDGPGRRGGVVVTDRSETGRVERVNGPLVEVSGLRGVAALDVIEVGPLRIPAEVVSIRNGRLTAEAFEYTGGLRVGDAVTSQQRPLSARLGPDLLGGVFDGLLRPLEHGPDWLAPGWLVAPSFAHEVAIFSSVDRTRHDRRPGLTARDGDERRRLRASGARPARRRRNPHVAGRCGRHR